MGYEDEDDDDDKVFHCTNPTFKIKAGEKKVRKKREKKSKVKASNNVPEIKLSFNLGESGVGIGVKEINLGDLSSSKPGRGRKRKVDLDAFAPSSLKTKLFSPDTTSSNNPTESFQIKVLNPSQEREEQRQPLDMSKKEVNNDDVVSKNMMDGNA